eukprot:8694-Pelagococcus_subviridis.AAC.1
MWRRRVVRRQRGGPRLGSRHAVQTEIRSQIRWPHHQARCVLTKCRLGQADRKGEQNYAVPVSGSAGRRRRRGRAARRVRARAREDAAMSGTRGIVRHGAAFSKHFAACTLDARRSRDDHLGTPDVVADDADADAASEKSRPRAFASADDVVDVVLAAKDGWGRELLAELCDDLGLPRFGADDAKGGASFGTTE